MDFVCSFRLKFKSDLLKILNLKFLTSRTVGFYCNNATSSTPIPCPIGTYSTATGLKFETECTDCPAGHFCDLLGMNFDPNGLVDRKCQAGFYCPNKSTSKQQQSCPVGSYCPVGAASPIICPDKEFSSSTNQASCDSCPSRYYCTGGIITECPIGKFCPVDTDVPENCTVGTWSDVTLLKSADECKICPPGKICSISGISSRAEMEDCPEGFWCHFGVRDRNDVLAESGTSCQRPLLKIYTKVLNKKRLIRISEYT